MKLNIRKLHPDAIIPGYATDGAAGLDLSARIPFEIYLQPGVRVTIPTGIAIELPDGFVGYVCSRSGLAHKHGASVLNAPGVIDCDFVGEIGVILINHGEHALKIAPNDRIAQLVIAPVIKAELVQAEALKDTERGEGRFGSTGVAA